MKPPSAGPASRRARTTAPTTAPTTALAAAALALMLSLAACSAEGEESGTTPSGVTATTQGEPSEQDAGEGKAADDEPAEQGSTPADAPDAPSAPGPVPDRATETTPAGVKAHAEHWVSVLNHAVATGDSAGLRSLSDGCATCDALADGVDTLAEAGGHVTGEGWLLQEVVVQPGLPTRQAEAQLTVLRRPEAVEESAGAEPRYFEGGEESYRMTLRHDGETWLVTALDPVLS